MSKLGLQVDLDDVYAALNVNEVVRHISESSFFQRFTSEFADKTSLFVEQELLDRENFRRNFFTFYEKGEDNFFKLSLSEQKKPVGVYLVSKINEIAAKISQEFLVAEEEARLTIFAILS